MRRRKGLQGRAETVDESVAMLGMDLSNPMEMNGRPEWTRTIDLFRVKSPNGLTQGETE